MEMTWTALSGNFRGHDSVIHETEGKGDAVKLGGLFHEKTEIKNFLQGEN